MSEWVCSCGQWQCWVLVSVSQMAVRVSPCWRCLRAASPCHSPPSSQVSAGWLAADAALYGYIQRESGWLWSKLEKITSFKLHWTFWRVCNLYWLWKVFIPLDMFKPQIYMYLESTWNFNRQWTLIVNWNESGIVFVKEIWEFDTFLESIE